MTAADLVSCPAFAEIDSALGRLLAAHAIVRQVARRRDDTSLPSCRLSLQERLLLSGRLAPFPPRWSPGGDPLGDACHCLANSIVGFGAMGEPPIERWPVALFGCGPSLMSGVLQAMFGSELFFGNHALIDHLGVAHGVWAGLRIQSRQQR